MNFSTENLLSGVFDLEGCWHPSACFWRLASSRVQAVDFLHSTSGVLGTELQPWHSSLTLATLTWAGISWRRHICVLLARDRADLCRLGVEVEERHNFRREEMRPRNKEVGWVWLGFRWKHHGLRKVVLKCEVGEGGEDCWLCGSQAGCVVKSSHCTVGDRDRCRVGGITGVVLSTASDGHMPQC